LLTGEEGDIVIVGYPGDEGVIRNGGREGACSGPSFIRLCMQKVGTVLNPEFNIDLRKIKISDSGDVATEASLEEFHELLHNKVHRLIANGKIPFVIGGGNDQSFPNGYALVKHYQRDVGVINIDAHLDVRPLKDGKAHSGSPFRQLLETPEFSAPENNNKFVEFAAQGSQCSAIHADYVRQKGGKIVWLSEIKKFGFAVDYFKKVLNELGDHIFVSFDIDSICGADCQGVSAPAVIGLSAQDALDICFAAGQNPNVKLFDLSECNPEVECSSSIQTIKLAAFMFYYFALGVASRKSV